jgi:hypothetical protein
MSSLCGQTFIGYANGYIYIYIYTYVYIYTYIEAQMISVYTYKWILYTTGDICVGKVLHPRVQLSAVTPELRQMNGKEAPYYLARKQ